MNIRTVVSAVIAVVTVVVLCAGGLGGALAGGTGTGQCLPANVSPASASTATPPGTPRTWPPTGPWDGEQVANAAAIVTTGTEQGIPARGRVIAVATAMQESTLRNLPDGDRDSVGLFQQRPSQGWGTAAQLQEPVYAASTFYARLVTVSGWETMPLTEAAQAVQNSAYPNAYAKWERPATDLVAAIAGAAGPPAATPPGCRATGPWTRPLPASVGSGFRSSDRPHHDGVDLIAPRDTIIRAASAGTVRTARCDAVHAGTGARWGCDRDGDPLLTRGCGWYVDIAHTGGLLTRYCHLGQRPQVAVGQHVTVGQPIGVVGSTGHSSGPHLHFEAHLHGDPTDPVPFMAARGASLGERTR
ncbi:M23 family metallopeptidase [Micromonospora sp. DT233]|uniref:M23 family metallopeptidase n=1 Tax=Micromonospora sp. DT233 TaxID=3393432 RepID=UPI003CF6142C